MELRKQTVRNGKETDGFQWHLAFLAPQFLEAKNTTGEGGRSSGGKKLRLE